MERKRRLWALVKKLNEQDEIARRLNSEAKRSDLLVKNRQFYVILGLFDYQSEAQEIGGPLLCEEGEIDEFSGQFELIKLIPTKAEEWGCGHVFDACCL